MAEMYRSIKRRTREIIYYQPSNSSIAFSATVSNGLLTLGDFEASGFFRCFILGDQIGQNRWGKVFKAAVKGAPEGFKPCRVERVRRWSLKRESKVSLFEEVRVLRGLDHPNVIDVYLFYRDDPKYYYLVLEHLEGPELFEHICAKEMYHESDVRKEFEVLLETIAYIHGEKVVIRNLAPGNILLVDPEDDGRIKLVDFSCACSLRNGLAKPTGGNPQFAAPEIINGESHGTSVDMWSLGIMLYILLAAAHPFYDGDTRRMFKKVKAGNLVFGERVWTYISNDAKDLIRGLLNVDPEKRLTASRALEHPWLLLDEEDANQPSILSEDLCRYNAKRKLRAAVFSVMAGRALWRLLPESGFDDVYEMGVRLGKGGYAEVFEATLRCPREGQSMRYAVKRTRRVNDKPTVEMGIRNEADILRSLDHPNIVELYEFFDNEPEYFYLVMELMEGGELYGRITKKKRYNEEEARDVCRILLGAIKYLHDQDVVHRDLKPQNLLLASKTDNTTIRIADFGFSCNLKGGLVRNQKGTPRYVAPEIINRRPYGTSVDMWAIGVIIYQLLCGTYPFNHSTQTRLFTFIRRGEFEFNSELWAGVSEEPKDLIRGLLTVDPERRLTATDALNHQWFIADGQALSVNDLSHTLDSLRLLNAKRKLQSSVKQVVVMQTIAGSS